MLELRAFERETCEPILGHFEAVARIPHFPAQFRRLCDRQAVLAGHNNEGCLGKSFIERSDQFFFLCPVHSVVSTFLKQGTVLAALLRLRLDPWQTTNPVRLSQKFKPSSASETLSENCPFSRLCRR